MMEAFYKIDNYPFDQQVMEKNLSQFLSEDEFGRIWLIEADRQLAGYIILTFGYSFEYGGRDAFIDEFFIVEGYRHQGIGNATLQFVLNEAPNLHIKALHLEVEKHNQAGNSLYRKHAFKTGNRTLMTRKLS
ncbi:GNAT family N-acetyltransferase [Fulvivirgaceae bacterium BMA12]|uniref:GNAT family N-acetyltransferase n=1 Tax=Agaribacillus aureus TaxID=3051825 RepID=A0ABT8LBH4_9BACT|nr:GNAT family N-acetyltransferase [Fulvivirgaceae bacterium BMA12]